MATRKSKKIMKFSLITGLLVALVTSGVWFTTYRYYNAKLIDERAAYEAQLAEKNEDLKRYRDESKKGYVIVTSKTAGQKITEDDVQEEMLPSFAAPDNVVQAKKDVVGKYLKINAQPGTMVTSEMIRDEAKLDPSERKEESQYIKLPLRVKKNDVVDIRIVFPTGEDFIVVAKKQLRDVDIPNQHAFFHTSEEEGLLLQAALVDAYINDAEIYMKQYVEPEMQAKADTTYAPNLDVLRLIQANPHIVNKAKWELAEELRERLEKRLEELDPSKKFRIGADAPDGSGVSKRRTGQGATQVQPEEEGQSVNSIIDQTSPEGPNVMEPVEPNVMQPVEPNVTKPNVTQPNGSGNNQPPVTSGEQQPNVAPPATEPDNSGAQAPKQDDSSLLGG